MAVDEIELVVAIEDRLHRRQEVAHRVVLEVRGTEGHRHGRHVPAGDVGIAGGERRHVVAATHELDDQLVHDALGATVALGRNALEGRRNLGDSQRPIHRRRPPDGFRV
jgi:hypothetical protein